MISLMSSFTTATAVALLQGNASIHLENISTTTKQYLFPSQGVNSMKSIIKCSKGPTGLGWDAGDTEMQCPRLLVIQITHFLQKISANTVNPTVLKYVFTRYTIPPFETWSWLGGLGGGWEAVFINSNLLCPFLGYYSNNTKERTYSYRQYIKNPLYICGSYNR